MVVMMATKMMMIDDYNRDKDDDDNDDEDYDIDDYDK